MTRLIPDWEIRITNFGLGYILMCLVVAIAATNTGNNGLYLVLAAMLAAMVVSGILSRRNVRGVSLRDRAGRERSSRRGRRCSKLRFENRLATATAQALFFLHEACRARSGSIRSSPGRRREVMVEGSSPGAASTAMPTRVCCRAFRSGSFASTGTRRLAREIVVYPLPEASAVAPVPPEDSRGGRPHPRRRGGGADIRTLRDFVPGRRSARPALEAVGADAPLDRSRARSGAGPRRLPRARQRAGGPGRPGRAACDFERRISRCAGQALLLLSRGGEVGFHARGVKVPASSGRRGSALGSWKRSPGSSRSPPRGAPAFPRRCAAATCGGSCT